MRYEIKGGNFPVVMCYLDNGEQMITEKGSMAWMTPNMIMETHGGGIGKMFSKAFSGESMFQNTYTANGPGMITFGSSFPGCIKPVMIAPGQEMIFQKGSFLASQSSVELSIHFNKKGSVGFFGGEGFIMQRLSGNGLAFVEIDGEFVEYEEVYAGSYYGTLRSEVQRIWEKGNIIIFDIDVKGGVNLKKLYSSNALAVFIQPPSIEELRKRLIGRGTDSMEAIERRVAKAEEELTYSDKFDVVLVNDSLEEALATAEKIVEEFASR